MHNGGRQDDAVVHGPGEEMNNNDVLKQPQLGGQAEMMEVDGASPEPENQEAGTTPQSNTAVNNNPATKAVHNAVDSDTASGTGKLAAEQQLDLLDDSAEIYSDDDESRPCGLLEHKFTDIGRFRDADLSREKRKLSDAVKIRCLPWRILLMFRFANTTADRPQRCLGVFLQCNADSESTSWSCNAKAELTLISQKRGCADMVRRIEHMFYSKENDWGYNSFINLTDLFDPEKGFYVDDSIVVRARVTADAPHGVDWDSKKYTGFVGLRNQGATCYLNSLLQALYFTNKLRKAVFLMPTESDDSAMSVALALQRVLYELQFSDTAVGTKKLTRSFGWETLDSFMQHDAQELCRVLLDNMESKMKGTSVEDVIPGLFCGRMLSYIKCKHVPYESKREENFYDIQLKVNGNKTLYDAFKEYIAVETLDHDNKYDAGENGLQEAEKGVIFIRFPPVLYLQLMRFQYDHVTDTNIKINDRLEFPYWLELDQYLRDVDPATPARYFLHAVLVHSGDNHGGHYVVYLNSGGDNKWYKFDDDVVARCSRKEAITMNYGGFDEELGTRLCTNAYMLVYILESAMADVLCPVESADIPASLARRFTEEQRVEEQKRREKADAHLYATVHLVLEEDFHGWQGCDLYNPNTAPIRPLRVPKGATLQQLQRIVAETLRQPVDKLRLWVMRQRKNGTIRLQILEMQNRQTLTGGTTTDCPALVLWVERPAPDFSGACPTDLAPFDPNNDLLVFLKYYDPRHRQVIYCGSLIIRHRSPLSTIYLQLRARAGLPANQPLMLFEERHPYAIEPIGDPDAMVNACVEMVFNGNIIVFQPDLGNASLPTAVEYFRDMYFQVDVCFLDKSRPDDRGFILPLSTKTKYWDLAKEVGLYLDVEPEKIQFLRAHTSFSQKDSPGVPVPSTYDGSLKDLLGPTGAMGGRLSSPSGQQPPQHLLYYQRLGISVQAVENMRQLRCIFVNSRLVEEQEMVLNVNKTGRVADLLEEATKKIQMSAGGSGRLRLLEVSANRIIQQLVPETKIVQLPHRTQTQSQGGGLATSPTGSLASGGQSGWCLRLEEVPVDELEVSSDETIVHIAHFQKEGLTTFGVPFTMKIHDGELLSSVRERVRRRLEVAEKDFDKWRFAIVASRASYFPDDQDTAMKIGVFSSGTGGTSMRPWLGIEHKPSKRPRSNVAEKPIKIRN